MKKDVREPIKGYTLTDYRENVQISCSRTLAPKAAEIGSKVYLFQEPTNPADDRAVRVMLLPQRIPFAYLYRGPDQDIVNKYLDKKWKIVARISNIENVGVDIVYLNIAFFKPE